jgi:hypothetical protein
MTAGFQPPAHWTEISSQLKASASGTLGATGTTAIIFQPNSANQRWVVTSCVVSTNQASTAVVTPYATMALNTTDITQLGQSYRVADTYNGSQNTFSGALDVGPCDFLAVLAYPPPGATAGQISALVGVIASVVLYGTKYTRRA